MNVEIDKSAAHMFNYRMRGSIWENRVEYYPDNGIMNFVQKDVTSHLGNRFECERIFTMKDIRYAIRDNRLPKLSSMEERQLMRYLGIDAFDFIHDDWKEGMWYIDAKDIFEDKIEVETDILDTFIDIIYYLYAEYLITGQDSDINLYLRSIPEKISIKISSIRYVRRNTDSIHINNIVLNKNQIGCINYAIITP